MAVESLSVLLPIVAAGLEIIPEKGGGTRIQETCYFDRGGNSERVLTSTCGSMQGLPMLNDLPQGEATFRGRGLAFVHGSRIVVKVCPTCSQWNAPKAAQKGVCGWCSYVPCCEDLEPATRYVRR